jgi:hypothetical protein
MCETDFFLEGSGALLSSTPSKSIPGEEEEFGFCSPPPPPYLLKELKIQKSRRAFETRSLCV